MQMVEVSAFTVTGLTVRTTNAAEMPDGDTGKIGPLWSRFMEGEGAAIPGVADVETVYAVYSNYERDETGAYDFTLGKAVAPNQRASEHFITMHVPSANYLIFPASDRSPAGIKEAWSNVSMHFAQNRGQHRAFTYDFEQHSPAGSKIFIAIR